jgi:hypothetical protein
VLRVHLVVVVVLVSVNKVVADSASSERTVIGPGGLTVSVKVVLWTSEPEVPVIVTLNVPVAANEDAVRVRPELVLPFAAGVTGFVTNEAVTPLGRPEALKLTGKAKPFRLVTVVVVLPVPP